MVFLALAGNKVPDPEPKKKQRKRNRPTVVCSNCRKKKIKCNRGHPCTNCIRSGISGTCDFGNGTASASSLANAVSDKGLIILQTSPGMLVGANVALSQPTDHLSLSSASVLPQLLPDSTVQNELEFLKNKLKVLEASITVASLHKPSISSYSSSPQTKSPASVASGHLTSISSASTNHSHGNPTINVSRTLPLYMGVETRSLDPGIDFLGVNPVYSNEDNINFYRDLRISANFHFQGGQSSKPLPLLSMARIDPAIKLFMKHKHLMRKDFEKKCMFMKKNNALHSYRELSQNTVACKRSASAMSSSLLATTDTPTIVQNCPGAGSCSRDSNVIDPLKSNLKAFLTAPLAGGRGANISREQILDYGKTVGITLNPQSLKMIDTLDAKILAVLPSRKVLWRLVDRFFAVLYPFFPVVDEHTFKPELKHIIGVDDGPRIMSLNLESNYDYIFVGLVLIMLRLSYLSFIKNSIYLNESAMKMEDNPDLSGEACDLKWLLNNPVPVEVMDVTQLCLQKVDLTRKPALVTFQCLLLLRSLRLLAPEEGESLPMGDTQTFTGLLINQAYALGLNRDPDVFAGDPHNQAFATAVDSRANNLRRKLWHFMVAEDILGCITLGNSITLREYEYDTKLPCCYQENENIFDINLEMDVVSSFALFEKIRQPIVDVLDIMLNTRQRASMNEFTAKVSKLERMLKTELGSFEEYLNPSFNSSGFLKIMKLRLFFYGQLLLISVSYALYLYYDRKENNLKLQNDGQISSGRSRFATYYFKKFVYLGVSSITPLLPELLDESHNYLEKGAALILSPIYETLNHDSTLCNAISCCKLVSTRSILKNNPLHTSFMLTDLHYKARYDTINDLIKEFEQLRKTNTWVSNILSNRYFVAWKMRKIQMYISSFLRNDSFFDSNPELTKDSAIFYTTEELNEFRKICLIGNEKFKRSSEYTSANSRSALQKDKGIIKGPHIGGSDPSNELAIPFFDDTVSDVFWQYFFTVRNNDEISHHYATILQIVNAANSKAAPSNTGLPPPKTEIDGSFCFGATPINAEFPGTPQDFPIDAIACDFGLFNGQSFDEFLTNL